MQKNDENAQASETGDGSQPTATTRVAAARPKEAKPQNYKRKAKDKRKQAAASRKANWKQRK